MRTAVAAAAIAVSTHAQVRYLKASQPYTFTGTAAFGTGTMTYQWYRDGVEIPNATSESYTMPANVARGADVEIIRGVVSDICPYNTSYTNRFLITFVTCVTIGNVCWATASVDAYQTFASRPDMYTAFYQWNRATAWPATGSISGWSASYDNSATWTVNPCPDGWRLPTQAEFQVLTNGGSTWANANTRGNAVAGRFYGPNHATAGSCSLPSNMTDCIFLPAGGARNVSAAGEVLDQGNGGDYWTTTQMNSASGYCVLFNNSSNSAQNHDRNKAYGFNVRCVQ